MKKTILKASVSLILLFILFKWIVNPSEVVSVLTGVNLVIFSFAVMFGIFNNLVSAVRWQLLIDRANIKYWYLLRLYFIGNFFNNFMPSSIGGDVYKIFKLAKETKDGALAATATFMERFSGLTVLAIMASTALVITDVFPWYYGVLLFSVFTLGFLVGVAVLFKFHKKHPKLESFYIAFSSYRNKYSILGKALLLSVLVQGFSVLMQYFIVLSLGFELPVAYAFFAFLITGFVAFLPISFNGVGIQEYMYITLLAVAGISPEAAVAASLTFYILKMILSLIGAAFYYFER